MAQLQRDQPWRTVRVDEALVRELRSSLKVIPYTLVKLPLAYALSFVAPGSELSGKSLLLRNPRTGEEVATLLLGNGRARVNPAYSISGEDLERLLREVHSALYTVALAYSEYITQRLNSVPPEERDEPFFYDLRCLLRNVQRAAAYLSRQAPVPMPEVAAGLEKILDDLTVLPDPNVIYRVKAPTHPGEGRALATSWSLYSPLHVTMDFAVNGSRAVVMVLLDSTLLRHPGGPMVQLEVYTGHAPWRRTPLLYSLAQITVMEPTLREDSYLVSVDGYFSWNREQPHDVLQIPLRPGDVEEHVSIVKAWRRTISEMIERWLSTAGKPEREDRAHEATLLTVLKDLFDHGDWELESVETEVFTG